VPCLRVSASRFLRKENEGELSFVPVIACGCALYVSFFFTFMIADVK